MPEGKDESRTEQGEINIDKKEFGKEIQNGHNDWKEKIRGAEEMVEKETNVEDEYRESFPRHMLMDSLLDKSLDFVVRTNPLDVVVKEVKNAKAELGNEIDLGQEVYKKVPSMMHKWLDMYDGVLDEGKNLPRDLIGRAAELAKEQRSTGK